MWTVTFEKSSKNKRSWFPGHLQEKCGERGRSTRRWIRNGNWGSWPCTGTESVRNSGKNHISKWFRKKEKGIDIVLLAYCKSKSDAKCQLRRKHHLSHKICQVGSRSSSAGTIKRLKSRGWVLSKWPGRLLPVASKRNKRKKHNRFSMHTMS